jgi:hypothetical protein
MHFTKIAAIFLAASVGMGTVFGFTTPASAEETITCSSQDNRRNSCSVPSRSRVRFIRQLSDASCRGNWNRSRNRIWVKNGCRAEFLVDDNRNDRYDRGRRNNRDDRYYRRGRDNRDDRYYRRGIYKRDDRYRRGIYKRDDRYYRNDRYDRDNSYYRNRNSNWIYLRRR